MRSQSTHKFSSSRAPTLTALLLAIIGLGLAGPPPAAAASVPYRVKDINTSGSSNPSELTDLDGTLMFAAKGGGRGNELWRSDGTAAGTVRVKDINPGGAGSSPAWLAAIDGRLYFSANDGAHGRELWLSDGTLAGTKLVKDIRGGGKGSDPRCFTAFQDAVYFFADTGAVGSELWRTDGTRTGTVQVKDIEPGVDGFNDCPIVFAGRLYFVHSRDWASGDDVLYVSDGTAVGTKPFKDRNGRQLTGYVGGFTIVGSRLFFLKDDHLWVTLGNAASTRKISDTGGLLVGLGNAAYIFDSGYADEGYDRAIWRSVGTPATTTLVKQFPRSLNGFDWALAASDRVFFGADYEGGQDTIWTTDGTAAGTQSVGKQVNYSEGVVLGSVLYFEGYSYEEAETYTGPTTCVFEPVFLWRSDGTADGTYNVNPELDYCLYDLTAVGNSLYFVSAAAGRGNELWRYVP